MRKLLLLTYAALAITATASQQSASYIKVSQSVETISLQTAAHCFQAPNKPTVWIVGVTHLGTKQYYQALQKFLDPCTVVYYEAIRQNESAPRVINEAQQAEIRAGLSGPQPRLAQALGLTFQLNQIDYAKPNFINVDISFKALIQAYRDAKLDSKPLMMLLAIGESPLSEMLFNLLDSLCQAPAIRQTLLYVMISLMGDERLLTTIQNDHSIQGLSQILLSHRNKVVIDYLKDALAQGTLSDKDSIALFYGAAHASELEERLCAQGYQPATTPAHSSHVFTAFTAQLKDIPFRSIIDQQLKSFYHQLHNRD